MKDTKLYFLAFLLVAGGIFFAFKSNDRSEVTYEFMTISTVESIIPGGFGRSRMLISYSDGKTEDQKIQNLYSIGGITMKNISENDVLVSRKLEELSGEGWELYMTDTGVQSPSPSRDQGIFLTRFRLRRAK